MCSRNILYCYLLRQIQLDLYKALRHLYNWRKWQRKKKLFMLLLLNNSFSSVMETTISRIWHHLCSDNSVLQGFPKWYKYCVPWSTTFSDFYLSLVTSKHNICSGFKFSSHTILSYNLFCLMLIYHAVNSDFAACKQWFIV